MRSSGLAPGWRRRSRGDLEIRIRAATGARTGSGPTATTTSAPPAATPRPAAVPQAGSFAELEESIRRRLVEDGVVVRGHDVARAVAVATGSDVIWRVP